MNKLAKISLELNFSLSFIILKIFSVFVNSPHRVKKWLNHQVYVFPLYLPPLDLLLEH
jgi:hypothetical protein